MKKQLIALGALFVVFTTQITMSSAQPSLYDRMKASAARKYDQAKGYYDTAKGYYDTTKGYVKQEFPTLYDTTKSYVKQQLPSLSEFAENSLPLAQKGFAKTLINENVDKLMQGVPYGNEIVDAARTAYMSQFYPHLKKEISKDAYGNTVVQWVDKTKQTFTSPVLPSSQETIGERMSAKELEEYEMTKETLRKQGLLQDPNL